MLAHEQINGCKIVFDYCLHEEAKELLPMIFLHGMGADLNMWEEQIAYFSKYRTTLAITLQGHGDSEACSNPQGYSISHYAQTVFSLMDIYQMEKAIILGNSMGGVIGYEMLSKKPEKVAMLFTHGTTPKLNYSSFAANLISLVDRAMIGLLGVKGMMKILTKQVSQDEAVQNKLLTIMAKADKQMIPHTHKAISRYDFTPIFKKSHPPIVMIRGMLDEGINRCIDEIKEQIPADSNVDIIDIEGVGHVLNMEVPLRYHQIIEEKIKEKR